jgi:hypothetical protein
MALMVCLFTNGADERFYLAALLCANLGKLFVVVIFSANGIV